jgi:hypothetical protein
VWIINSDHGHGIGEGLGVGRKSVLVLLNVPSLHLRGVTEGTRENRSQDGRERSLNSEPPVYEANALLLSHSGSI